MYRHQEILSKIPAASASNATVDTIADHVAQADTTFPPPPVPPQPVMMRIDTLSVPIATPGQRMGRVDDLAPAKGIMLSLLLGLALWGALVAFVLN